MSSMRLRCKRKVSEDSSDKDDRAKQKKRKVSELGPAWTKDELETFYRAYRKHGKNWKKVASVMRNRTIDMVEALYNANASYLSLPEGYASVADFVARMTDEGQGRRGAKAPAQSNSGSGQTASGFGGPSPAKKPRSNRPRVAGSKLPHFLVDEKPKTAKAEENDSDEYDFNNVVKAVATLAEGSQEESGTPSNEKNGEKAGEEEVGNELVKRKAEDTSEAIPDASSPVDARNKVKRPPSKRLKQMRQNAKEQANPAEAQDRETTDMGAVEDSKQETKPQRRSNPPRAKKRSRQLFTGDQNSGLDTLATLADHLLPRDGTGKADEGAHDQQEFQDLVSLLSVDRVKKEQDKDDTDLKQQPTSPDTRKRRNTRRPEKLGEASTSGKQEAIVYRPNGRPKRIPKTSKRHEDYEHDLDKLEDSGSNQGDTEVPRSRGKKKVINELPSESKNKALAGADNAPPVCKHDCPYSTKARLFHCLSNPLLQQWCTYEWLYSPVDWPWFDRNEFVEYLNHAGLGHVSKLTRTEWAVIRSSLGKPRRLSSKFLQEEREKLEGYRESVRAFYQDIRSGARDALPSEIARPLSVGQRVSARHPKTGELHDGRVLTVDKLKCRVQFDRPDLGVEFVWDINAMPVDHMENMSEQMRKRRLIGQAQPRNEVGHPSSHYMLNSLCRQAQMDNVDSVLLAKAQASEVAAAVQQGQAHSSAHAQAREAESLVLAELQRQLDKKEALLVELRRMNDEAARLSDDEGFKRQYATVILQLKDVNKQVSDALVQLRQRNRYQENLVPPWHSPAACGLDAYSGLSAGSLAEEITLNARKDARSLVSATIQAICCLKEGEETTIKPGNQPAKEGGLGSNANQDQVDQLNSSDKGDSSLQSAGTDESKSNQGCNQPAFASQMEAFIPTELVTSCLVPLLIVQTCTERHLPPSDVAAMIENAQANLRPRAASNHPLYKEIEQCFDVIKNQVTAQVAIHPNLTLPLDCHLR